MFQHHQHRNRLIRGAFISAPMHPQCIEYNIQVVFRLQAKPNRGRNAEIMPSHNVLHLQGFACPIFACTIFLFDRSLIVIVYYLYNSRT